MTTINLRITNILSTTATPTDIDDLTHDFDFLLDLAYASNLIPDVLDYFYDDAHAAPFDYLSTSPTYLSINNLTPDNAFDPENPDALRFNLRMIIEVIRSEMIDFKNDPEMLAEYFETQNDYLTEFLTD